MIRACLLFFAALVLTIACNDALTGPESLAVRHENSAVHILNRYASPVHFILIERNDLPVIDWVPCISSDEACQTIAPGQTVVVPLADIVAFDPGDGEAVLYWWVTTVVGGEPRPSAPQSVVVKLNRLIVAG